MFQNAAGDYGAVASSASEASLLQTVNQQPIIPPNFFSAGQRGYGKAIKIIAKGVFSNTATPTMIFQVRLGTTSGSSFLSGTSVGVSPTITSTSGVTNVFWGLELDLICKTPGTGTTNCTLFGAGKVESPAGFATPFVYALEPTTPNTATWTCTIDDSLQQYVNLSMTWGTSSASNTITCKFIEMYGLN